MISSLKSQKNSGKFIKKTLAIILAGVFLLTNILSWADNTLAPASKLNSEDFKYSLKVAAICKYIEHEGNLDDKFYLNDVLARLDAEKNSSITILPHEIIVEIPNEGLAVRYFDPTRTNVITPYSDISKLQTKVIGPRLNRQIIHIVKVSYEEEVRKISPYLLELVEKLFKNHKYSTYGTDYALNASIGNIVPIGSIEDMERRVGDRNVFLPLLSDSDKESLLRRVRNIQHSAAGYIQEAVKEYIRQRYGVECEVVGIYANGSSLYGWSKEVRPDDTDNVTLIRLIGSSLVIRDHMYEVPEHLKRPGINISGTAIQSVNALNSDHPHTKTALGSAYISGIPIFEKERLVGQLDRKNMLFFAFTGLESGRMELLSTDKKKYAKWINRLIDAKAVLFKLGIIEKFNHHKEWEKFDGITKAVLANDDEALGPFINDALREYIELRVIIEQALQEESAKALKEIVTAYSNCNETARRAFVNEYTKKLEKANGSEYGFPPEEHNFKTWSNRRKLAADKEALEREHLTLLGLNDPAINLALAKDTPFESIRQLLRDRGIKTGGERLPEQNKDKGLDELLGRLSQEKDIKVAYRLLYQIVRYKEKPLPALIDLLYDGKEELKPLILNTLGEIGSPRAVPFIMDICSGLLKAPIKPGSKEESLLDFGIEALGRCVSDKSIYFLLGILEKSGSNYHNASTSNQFRAKQALTNLCKNPAIRFTVIWDIKEKMQRPEISKIDRTANLIELLDEMPVDLKLKKDLMKEFLGRKFGTLRTSAVLTTKEIEIKSNSITGLAGEHRDILKQRIDELSTVVSRRGPPANFVITTDLTRLGRDHNDGLPFIATSDPDTKTVFLHPYFFSFSKEKQLEILARELICYLYRDMRDKKNILVETKAVLAIGRFIEKVKTVSNGADVVIGIPFCRELDTIGNVRNTVIEGLKKSYPDKKCVVICLGNPDTTVNEKISRLIETINSETENIRLVTFISPIQGKGMALRFMIEGSLALDAKACAFIDADEKKITAEWPHLLLDPVLGGKYDFVSARYSRHHHTATITNHFAYPLMAAMYGKSVRQPIGGEFAFSADLLGQYLEDPDVWVTDIGTFGIDNWLTSTAIFNAAAMCEVDLGTKVHNFGYFDKRSSMLKQVAKTLFAQIKQNINYCRTIDSIEPDEIFGPALNLEPLSVSPDYRGWIGEAKENFMDNRKVCKEFLSPEMDDYLEKLFNSGEDEFNFPADKWADYVYEFVRAYISENIGSKETFWDALSALWQARVGSFMKETRDASREQAEKNIEGQLKIFGNKKRHLIDRLRDEGQKIKTHPKIEIINQLPEAKVKVFVFDWDGTIIHTFPQWKSIFKEVLSNLFGKDKLDADKLPYQLGSPGAIHWAVREAKRKGIPAKSEQEYEVEYVEAMRTWFSGLGGTSDVLMPGAKEFLARLSNSGFKLFAISAAYRSEKVFQAQALGIERLFEEIIGKENITTSRLRVEQLRRMTGFKTEHLRRIKEEHELSNQEMAMFGDTPMDVLAAKKAGIIAVGIAENEEAREALIASGADIIINGDYSDIDLLPILNRERTWGPTTKHQMDYIDSNKSLFKDMFGEGKQSVVVRVPVEAIESTGRDNVKDFLATFQEAPNGYIELYHMSGIGEVSESIYHEYGLRKKSLPENFKRTRENTVTLLPALKGEEINQSTILSRLGSIDISPQDSILSPIGLQYDPAGLIRATILGLKMMDIARQIEEKGADITKDQAFKDKIQLDILEEFKNVCDTEDLKNFNLTPDDIIALATGNINNIIAALQKLIRLLPITPIDTEELRQIYRHVKEVITAA